MKKQSLLFFSRASVDADVAHPQELVALLNDSGEAIEAHYALLEDAVCYIDGDKTDVIDGPSGVSLGSYDNIYFRYTGQARSQTMAIARFCETKGIPYVDRELLRRGSYSKMSQYMHLWAAQVAIPKTLIAMPHLLVQYYQHYGFSFPLIMKAVEGTRGQDNYLIQDEQQLRALADKNTGVPFVLQAFVPNDGDYRVWVIDGEVMAVMGRKAPDGSHLNNTSQGGSATWLDVTVLPEAVRTMCTRAAQFLDRDIAGVDIVQSLENGHYYCFEVNRAPQIERTMFADRKAALVARYLAKL